MERKDKKEIKKKRKRLKKNQKGKGIKKRLNKNIIRKKKVIQKYNY
jgi:hypothetical protein